MKIAQAKFREIVFQLLYSHDMGAGEASREDMVEMIAEQLKVSSEHVQGAYSKMEKIWEEREQLDTLIAEMSVGYAFDRIKSVERNILRLAAYEILFDEAIPHQVAMA
ncbi:MAG: utilization substance protein, partial [Chlamydiales bacterium]|nr:utilization substance protein [Chlamydiales bacterium]